MKALKSLAVCPFSCPTGTTASPTKKVTPLTKDFDPSIENVDWSLADGQIYLTAEDRDYVNMFVLNPRTGKITKLPIQGDYAYRYDLAAHASVVGYLSYKTMEPASAYVFDLKTKKGQTYFAGAEALGDAESMAVSTCLRILTPRRNTP